MEYLLIALFVVVLVAVSAGWVEAARYWRARTMGEGMGSSRHEE